METFEYTNHDILYHCRTTIVCASTLGAELGVNIKRLDFSDPQGGKGACDHKEASIKSHMHIYLNSGHDIETPEQMTDAIRSSKKTLENDDQESVEVAAHKACLESIVNEAASEIAPKHPIVYDAYNLWEMVSQKKLNEFSITILKDICTSLGLTLQA